MRLLEAAWQGCHVSAKGRRSPAPFAEDACGGVEFTQVPGNSNTTKNREERHKMNIATQLSNANNDGFQ